MKRVHFGRCLQKMFCLQTLKSLLLLTQSLSQLVTQPKQDPLIFPMRSFGASGNNKLSPWHNADYHSSFDNMMSYAQKQSVYAIDCASVNRIVPDNTPRIPASQLAGINNKSRKSTMSFNGLSPYQNGSRIGSVNDLRKLSLMSAKVIC